ncbi:MAG TPA: response regulator [Saprospiraceae bacterium]|nr:response regulator [Saprospiraceae bacterium]HMP14071.1 response regulator [Saprospiraceae bacterium]
MTTSDTLANTLCAQPRPCVVLSDVSLPDRGGLEGLRELCTTFSDIQVIMLTVHDDFPTIQAPVCKLARELMS